MSKKKEKKIKGDDRMPDTCRFYVNKYPEVDDVVMVKVNEIGEVGAYVSLLEYNNIQGMILLSELSRRRIRSISKLIRIGNNEVVVVLRVNKEKGYIDLSKSRVTPEEKNACFEKYNKAKAVNNILFAVAKKCIDDTTLEELYESVGWPLAEKYKDTYNAFKLLAANNKDVLKDITFKNEKIKKELIKIVQKRLKPQDVKVRTDFELSCFKEAGISAIRKALIGGEEYVKEKEKEFEMNGKIKTTLIAPPLYAVTYVCKNQIQGKKILDGCLEYIKKSIEEEQGKLVVKNQPRVVSKTDEESFTLLLQKLAEQNREREADSEDDQEYMA